MINKQFNNYNIEPANSNHGFQDFLRQHRIIATLMIVGFVALSIALVVFLFFRNANPEDSYREPENAPYATFEHEYLIEYPAQESLSEEILFELRLIILSADEIASAPTNNSGEQQYVISIDEDSYQVSDINNIENSELYTMNLNISDGRKYVLQLLINNTYHEEYAFAILQRTDIANSPSYIITFTSNTSEYYSTLGTDNANNSEGSSAITDHLTGAPLNPLPNNATEWINSLNLTNPQMIHSTLPSLR